jgi:membrane-associated protease RseP (regulator of RpoE activity)
MNCRDFLTEFEDRNALSETATLHLNDCDGCRKINGVQTRVWQIIERFEPVAAPKDFDFRVKARIANSKSSDFQPQLLPVLRYVLPLTFVGLILAFVVFNGIYTLDDKTIPQVAQKDVQAPTQKENQLTETSPNQQVAGINDSQVLSNEKSVAEDANVKLQEIGSKRELRTFENKTQLIAGKSVKKPQTKTVSGEEKNSGGSHLNAETQAQVLTPKGIPNSTQTIENPSNFNLSSSITAEQILSELGIGILSENGRRQVKTIKPNSVAERSGIKVGDLIEAIDGKKLSSEPIPAQTFEVKKLTILRGTEKIEITLRNLPN